MFLLREALEGVACRLAALRMTDTELEELEGVLEGHGAQQDVSSDDGYYQAPGDHDFHYKIIRGSRSSRLEDLLLGDLYHFLRIFRYRSSVKQGRTRVTHCEHRGILEALCRRDGLQAESAMRAHISNARLSLAEALAQQT